MGDRILYMGSWKSPGMYLRRPDGGRLAEEDYPVERYRKGEVHVDASLAPRRTKPMYGRPGGALVWSGSGRTSRERQDIEYGSEECAQGQFFRHELDSGFTALSWWDRNQGDGRAGINSTFFLQGVRTSDEVLEAARAAFPRVFLNLASVGVALLELPLP